MRLIISVPRLPVATWNTRMGRFGSFVMAWSLLHVGVRGGDGVARVIRIEPGRPAAQRGEAGVLAAGEGAGRRIALMGPDVNVGLELLDDAAGEPIGACRVGCAAGLRRLPDPDGEPDVEGVVVDRGDRRDGAVVDHSPALGDRHSQSGV